jgi:phage terminase small subunit
MLTPRQHAFLHAYLTNGFNATQAAISAGYSENAARGQGVRMLANVSIQAAISDFQAKLEAKTGLTVEQLVEQLRTIAFADIGQVVEWNVDGVTIKPSTELTPAQRAFISEVSETPTQHGRKKSIKFYSRLTALDMLMKHLGGYTTLDDLISRMDEATAERIAQKILSKIQHEEK